MLADMITETVQKMGGAAKGTSEPGVNKPKSAYEKMEERAAEVGSRSTMLLRSFI